MDEAAAQGAASGLPELTADDVYLYAHGDGGLSLTTTDQEPRTVSLPAAERTVLGVAAGSGRVHVGGDDAPLAVDALTRLGRLGVGLEPFAAPHPPSRWQGGASTLHWACRQDSAELVDDLLERGADIRHRDGGGNTPLHQAAATGNEHAVAVLLAAGADPEARNARGTTPLMAAHGRGHPQAAALLARAADLPRVARFSASHYGVYYVWVVPVLLVLLSLALVGSAGDLGGVAVGMFAGMLLLWALVCPPPAFWAGGVPRELDGTTLVLRRFLGQRREVDLSRATLAATGGSVHRGAYRSGRWLLLAHPDGLRVGRSGRRRLMIADREKKVLAEQAPRMVVIALDGPRRTEVLGPVTAVLDAFAVRQLPSVRHQARPVKPRRWWQR